jgi:hypothetical protein
MVGESDDKRLITKITRQNHSISHQIHLNSEKFQTEHQSHIMTNDTNHKIIIHDK